MPRKQAFSGKQKKKQLQERRERKKDSRGVYDDDLVVEVSDDLGDDKGQHQPEVLHVHEQPMGDKDFDPNKFRLHFLKISADEMKKRKRLARQPITRVEEKDLEMSVESVYIPQQSLDFPKRPPWDFRQTKQQLEQQEKAYYSSYVRNLLTSHSAERLSYFELNLETWRQLWRVTEISDILLLITDIRHPALHVPPSLYHYLTEELKRDVIVVLNKVDLAPPSLVSAWRHYLLSLFPQARIICFTSVPKNPDDAASGFRSRRQKKWMKPLGPQQLLDVCNELVKDKVKLESWQEKLNIEDTATSAPDRHASHGDAAEDVSAHKTGAGEDHFAGIYQRYRDGILTIGCIGYPNVGKSSLLNGLVGRKVVSVSKTPGHTKHLQTIFLTPTVRLCDCPGLVFPSYVDKSLQILSGIFPIAQVREPYSAVAYLAKYLDLPTLLRLTHPDLLSKSPTGASRRKEVVWSAFDICESWAVKCGYFTAKASRPDVYRAANHILRMAVEGKLCLCLAPPTFFDRHDSWQSDPFTVTLTEQLSALAHSESLMAQLEGDRSDSESDSEEHAHRGDDDESDEDEGGGGGMSVDTNPFALLCDD